MNYSTRNRPQPTRYRYDLHDKVRKRIFLALEEIGNRSESFHLDRLLGQLRTKLMVKYGGLYRPAYEAAIQAPNPVIEHFLSCPNEMGLDYIELWLQCPDYWLSVNTAVQTVNEILREEAIGYELTPRVESYSDGPQGTKVGTVKQHPEFIRKDSQFVHQHTVQPCIDLLTNPAFAVANAELLDAFAKHRQADFDGAITSCGAAFESVLKTICDHKGWTYSPDKDTCSKLVDICYQNNLFPSFYVEVFKQAGTIRNKLSDAHGRGPVPLYKVGQEHVEHLIQLVAGHIVLLVKLAEI